MRISDWSSDVCSSDLADGKNGIGVRGLAQRHVVLQHADRETAEQVDDDDDDAGDRIALDELHRAIEAAVQLAFHFQVPALAPRLVLVDESRAQVGVDRQLLAGHRVEGEARGDLGHAFRSEEHTSELQSLMRISYAVFCWKKKTTPKKKSTE